MIRKTLVVLANSHKKGDRCLAGKELIGSSGGWKIGEWIRPVTKKAEGSVPYFGMFNALGHNPRMLEIIEIELAEPRPLPFQPENWLLPDVLKSKSWKSHGFFPLEKIDQLVDEPKKLWHSPHDERRVSVGYPEKMAEPASLYLIKPESIRKIHAYPDAYYNMDRGRTETKTRRVAAISYGGHDHQLAIDDPAFSAKNFPGYLKPDDEPIVVKLSHKKCVMTVSLTGPFNGFHYKIAAAILERNE